MLAAASSGSCQCSIPGGSNPVLPSQCPVLQCSPRPPPSCRQPHCRASGDLPIKEIYLEHEGVLKNLPNKKELPVKGVSIDASLCSGKHRGIWPWIAEQLPGCSSTSNRLGGSYCATYMRAVMVRERRSFRVTG